MWLTVFRRYLGFFALGNLVWEGLHMPLYTLWLEGTWSQIVLYGLHCTAGDVLIGSTAFSLALLVFASSEWPHRSYLKVGISAVVLGFAATVAIEWYSVEVIPRWAYSDLMPVIFGIGLSPLLQWLVVPSIAFHWARKTDAFRQPRIGR